MADPRYPSKATGLRRWSGVWKGAGKFSGRNVEAELSIMQQLGGKFDELNINIGIAPGQFFQGRAMYGGDLKASWSDSNGNAYPVFGKWVDGKLIADWGDPIRGRSTYGLAADGDLEVLDEIKRPDGNFVMFAKYKLRKLVANNTNTWDIRSMESIAAESMVVQVRNVAAGSKPESKAQDHDELYVFENGRGILEAGTQQIPVQPGTLVHLRKGVMGRFHSIEQPIKVLVVRPK